MATSGVISKVTVRGDVDEVWDYLTTNYNWGVWWGSDIRTLDPGWETGAKLQFSGSYQPTITIDEIIPGEVIRLSMPYLRLNIGIEKAGEGKQQFR